MHKKASLKDIVALFQPTKTGVILFGINVVYAIAIGFYAGKQAEVALPFSPIYQIHLNAR